MRITFDQNVNSAIAHGLRLRGIDVSTTADAALLGADDEAHRVYALQTGRVIFTQDADFPRMHAAGAPHAGIGYAKKGTRTTSRIAEFLELLDQCSEADAMKGKLEFC